MNRKWKKVTNDVTIKHSHIQRRNKMNVLAEIEIELKQELEKSIIAASLAEEADIREIILEKQKEKTHEDYAANIAMQLAKIAKKVTRQIADDIVSHLDTERANVAKVEIAGPRFINFFMKQDFLTDIVQTIIKEKDTYGTSDSGKGSRVQVEFVSVNPTGDLHLGH